MPEVGQPYLRDQYPHLRPEESDLLRRYLIQRGVENVHVLRTQVRVGEGEDPAHLDEPYRSLANDLSRYKIDALIRWPDGWEIVELKSRATHTAAGQLEAYRNLLAKADDEASEYRMTIVSYRAHPDLRESVDHLDVRVWTIPTADPSEAYHGSDVL